MKLFRILLQFTLCVLLAGTVVIFQPSESVALGGFPTFVHAGKVLDTDELSYNPTDEIIFPSIIKASDYFSNPLAEYYLYYAPHDAPGGISLAYSNSLDGPWTEYAFNPVISNKWTPHYNVSHVSSPHAIWNDVEGKLFLYFHGENTVTRLASSTDGIQFQYEQIVIDTSQFSGLSEASYARVFEYTIPSKSNKYIMLLMGNHGGTRKIYLAWSNDGRNWDTQTAPLITPNEDESGGTFGGGQLSAPFFFPWEGGYYVVYHAGSGNIHITEVGENFNLENHLGVLYDSTAIDNNRAATPFLITEGDTIYLFYTQGARLASNIAYATAHLSGSSAHWSLIDDDLDNYTQEWSISGTTGSVTQNNGYVTIVDDAIGSSGSYFFMTKKDFTAPAVPFTFEVRAKANAANTMNEITVRSGSYLISLYLTYGISGTAQNEQSAPSKSYTLDTTVYHNYRIVVHSDYTYDLYVDGNLAWSGAPNLGSGSDIFRIGGANTTTANMDVDYVRLGNGVIHV